VASGITAPDNNALIRSGEARLVGWSRIMLYLGFKLLPRSVFWPADFNGRSDNADVIRFVPKIPQYLDSFASKSFFADNIFMDISIEQIRQLPPDEQLFIAEQIWDGLLESGELVQQWQIEEVQRRIQDAKENPDSLLTHEQMWNRVEELRNARKN